MIKRSLITGFTASSILLSAVCCYAGTFTAFGPKAFTRGSGSPVAETASFNIKTPNTTYTLKVYNGGINSEYSKVSSAVISLNGTAIYGPSDFNQQISTLQKQVNVSQSNQLQVELRSATGSGLTITIEGVDNTPPAVAFSSPADNAYLNTPAITVTGTASDSISWVNAVTVNGAGAVISGESYSASLQLSEGPNAITATATDAAGNTGNSSITLILDTTPPKITLDAVKTITNNPQLILTGKIEDANPVSLTVNGTTVNISNNTFSATVNLAEGNNAITVTAIDEAGNSSKTEAAILLDTTPPTVTITSPVNQGTLNTSSLTVTGTSKDASSGIGSVTVNGTNTEISGDAYSATIQLKEGENQITVTATDAAGNTGQSTITIYLDTTAPAISISSPDDGSTVNTETVTVTGTVDDNAATVAVNGVIATVSDNTFTVPKLSLIEGANSISATATDQVGNKSSAVITITRLTKDTTAPVLRIISPSEGYTSEYQEIEVWGTIDDDSATVTVNGTIAKVFKRGTDNYFTASGIKLMEGRNIITVKAVDGAGNTSTATVTVTYMTKNSAITIQYPLDRSTVNYPSLGVWGTVADNITNVMVNGIPAKVFSNTFSATLTLIEGPNIITVSAYDMDGNMVTKSITVTYQYIDTTAPVISITSPSNGSTLLIKTITVTGTIDDNTATVTINGITAPISNGTFTSNVTLTEGTNTITVTAKDVSGNTSTSAITVTYATSTVPPDPAIIAPPVDKTVATTLASASAFLYTGENAIQYGVSPGTIEAKRVAVLRGKVTAGDGSGLSGVKITILSHPEYGATFTRSDGMFDMAVNGGGWLTVNYEKTGYLASQRQVNAPWQDYAWLPEIVMLPFDGKVTTIDLSSSAPIQVAQGNPVTDADGTRTATILFPSGNGATMQLSDGSWMPLTNISVRATEYTVGENGPKSMPGALPATSGYTYAVEYSLDEAVIMGAKYVSFSKPVISYTDNFLNFPVGGIVPVGWYDREKGIWIPSDNGKTIKILSVTNGIADIDVDGNGVSASSTALTSLGITDAERQTLAMLYQAGQSLWRVPISHFTPWDCNWPFGPPPDADPPALPEPETDNPLDNPCTASGSIIECQNQILGEKVDIIGTPFSFNYRSDRVPGRKAGYTLKIPISGTSIPASLKRIELEISVAGQKFSQSFYAATNQTYNFTWDGLDAYGRTLQGSQPIEVRIGYIYQAVYYQPAQFAASFGSFSGTPITRSGARQEITLWQKYQSIIGGDRIGAWDAKSQGMGAWTLSVHHAYDTSGKTLYLGNGARRSAENIGKIITTVAGNGGYAYSGDGGPATSATLRYPYGVAVDGQGNLFIADSNNSRIRKVAPDGIITTVAGNGTDGYSGDGGPATNAMLYHPTGVAVDGQGNLFIADYDNQRIRKVSPDGIITTAAGNGSYGYSGDGGPATNAMLHHPIGVAVDGQGNLFIADYYNQRIRKVSPDGIITTVAGNGTMGYSGDGGPATGAKLYSPAGLAVDGQGNLFIADGASNRIRKVSPDGIITTVAGNGNHGYSGDGGPATSAKFWYSYGVAVDGQGNLFIAESAWRIRKVSPDGIITTVAGNGNYGYSGDGGPATSATIRPRGVAVDGQGNLFIVDYGNNRIRKVSPPFPSFSDQDIAIPSEDGRELYQFNSVGKHLKTVDAITGITKYTFTYNTAGYLTSITDRDGNITTIERDGSNNATAIVAFSGQRSVISLDANGYLASVTNPNGEVHQMTYTSDGLLLSFTKPKGSASTLTYDTIGLLIKDEDPAGGFKALSRTTANNSTYTVALTTAMGRTDTYKVESLSTGDTRRTNTDPSGLTTVTNIGTNGTTTTTAPDGTVTTTTEGPDPRFRMQSPVTTAMTIKAPSGLTYTLSGSRTATLSDVTNLLSLTSMTDTVILNGKTFTNLYDAAQKKSTATTPVGRQRFTLLDTKGRVAQEQVAGLEATSYGYDEKGRLITVVSGQGAGASRTYTISYDSLNQISSITDAAGRTVFFTYDLAGRVMQQTLPDGRIINYTYDSNGNVTSITPPGRPEHSFTYTLVELEETYNPPDIGLPDDVTQYEYNLDKDLTLITRPDGQTISFNYDNGGRLSTMTVPTGNISYAYNSTTGNLSSVAAPGETLSYSYDGSLLTGTSWTGAVSGSIGFAYNNDFRITSESVNSGNSVSYSYDNDGLLTQAGTLSISRNTQNGLMTGTTLGYISDSYSYNSFGEMTGYSASNLFNVQYTRDSLGRITSKTETVNGTSSTYSYTYDQAGRLTDVSKNGVNTAHYEYDQNGNRLSYTSSNGSVAGIYDEQDRLVSYDGTTYSYTANGELQSKTSGGQTMTYNYDVFGNLVSATFEGSTQIQYIVDGQNRRIGKKGNGTLIQGFLYKDQLKPVAELDSAGNVVSRFVYGAKVNVPEYVVKGGVTYRIITDHLGSPRLIVNASTGAVAQQMEYDEFGNVTQDTNPGFQPFGFAGGLYDRDTKLVRFGARDYDAETSKWLSKDPVRFKGGDTNLYGYVTVGDPVNFIDPSGLFWDDVVNNFTTTNNTIPGVTTPSGMGLATAGTTAQAVGGTTIGQWALGGFGGQTLSGVAFTGLETGAIAAGVSVLNAALMTAAWETGVGIGSIISAIPVYGEDMNISEWWANYWDSQGCQ